MALRRTLTAIVRGVSGPEVAGGTIAPGAGAGPAAALSSFDESEKNASNRRIKVFAHTGCSATGSSLCTVCKEGSMLDCEVFAVEGPSDSDSESESITGV